MHKRTGQSCQNQCSISKVHTLLSWCPPRQEAELRNHLQVCDWSSAQVVPCCLLKSPTDSSTVSHNLSFTPKATLFAELCFCKQVQESR